MSDQLDNDNEKNKVESKDLGLFISKERQVEAKQLRNKKKYAPKIEFLLKARNDPTIHRYISEEELSVLKKNGLLH